MYDGGPGCPPGEGAIWGSISQSSVTYGEHPVFVRYSQPYSVVDVSDAVFCCQYCSKLL